MRGRFPGGRARALMAEVIAASVLAVPLVVAGIAVPASASTSTQPVPGTTALSGVACSTATTCEAVGLIPAPPPTTGSTPPPGFTQGVLVPITNGSPGSVQDLPATQSLLGAACPSATTCEAVGAFSQAVNDAPSYLPPVWYQGTDPAVMTVTNGSPGPVQIVPPYATEIPAPGVSLVSVACPSVTTCEAVGGTAGVATITNGSPGPLAYTMNGPLHQALGVACPSITSCEEVGVMPVAPGVYEGGVEPITSGSPGTGQPVPGTAVLSGVACPTATTCEAVGANASGQGVVVPITGGTPGPVQVVPGTSQLNGVACPSATTCEVVGGGSSGQGVVTTVNIDNDPDLAISVPANITVYVPVPDNFTTVNYPLATVTDPDGPALALIPPTCVPGPGSQFFVGTTPVTCWVTDPDDITGRVFFSFTVTVTY
jgi:hypothetical protein